MVTNGDSQSITEGVKNTPIFFSDLPRLLLDIYAHEENAPENVSSSFASPSLAGNEGVNFYFLINYTLFPF